MPPCRSRLRGKLFRRLVAVRLTAAAARPADTRKGYCQAHAPMRNEGVAGRPQRIIILMVAVLIDIAVRTPRVSVPSELRILIWRGISGLRFCIGFGAAVPSCIPSISSTVTVSGYSSYDRIASAIPFQSHLWKVTNNNSGIAALIVNHRAVLGHYDVAAHHSTGRSWNFITARPTGFSPPGGAEIFPALRHSGVSDW